MFLYHQTILNTPFFRLCVSIKFQAWKTAQI
nr:MAG TPA: hypothetical protein [Caudoviricetes sp.]